MAVKSAFSPQSQKCSRARSLAGHYAAAKADQGRRADFPERVHGDPRSRPESLLFGCPTACACSRFGGRLHYPAKNHRTSSYAQIYVLLSVFSFTAFVLSSPTALFVALRAKTSKRAHIFFALPFLHLKYGRMLETVLEGSTRDGTTLNKASEDCVVGQM